MKGRIKSIGGLGVEYRDGKIWRIGGSECSNLTGTDAGCISSWGGRGPQYDAAGWLESIGGLGVEYETVSFECVACQEERIDGARCQGHRRPPWGHRWPPRGRDVRVSRVIGVMTIFIVGLGSRCVSAASGNRGDLTMSVVHPKRPRFHRVWSLEA